MADTWLWLADLVLVLHTAVVAFVIGGLVVILLGNRLGWRGVNAPLFRWTHLGVIMLVVVQAWLGRHCVLTDLEAWLRAQAGVAPHGQSFIADALQRLLYIEAPMWALALAYTGFALLVAWAWWRHPPRSRRVVAAGAAGALR